MKVCLRHDSITVVQAYFGGSLTPQALMQCHGARDCKAGQYLMLGCCAAIPLGTQVVDSRLLPPNGRLPCFNTVKYMLPFSHSVLVVMPLVFMPLAEQVGIAIGMLALMNQQLTGISWVYDGKMTQYVGRDIRVQYCMLSSSTDVENKVRCNFGFAVASVSLVLSFIWSSLQVKGFVVAFGGGGGGRRALHTHAAPGRGGGGG